MNPLNRRQKIAAWLSPIIFYIFYALTLSVEIGLLAVKYPNIKNVPPSIADYIVIWPICGGVSGTLLLILLLEDRKSKKS